MNPRNLMMGFDEGEGNNVEVKRLGNEVYKNRDL